jgi:hypothetical protein
MDQKWLPMLRIRNILLDFSPNFSSTSFLITINVDEGIHEEDLSNHNLLE